jgi:hypothetical protein
LALASQIWAYHGKLVHVEEYLNPADALKAVGLAD